MQAQITPEQSNLLVKKCRALIRKGVTDEQWELASLLRETCKVIDQFQAGALQTVADSNKLQLQAAAEIKQLQAENKTLMEEYSALEQLGGTGNDF